jgi:hypothetical protein
MFLSFLRCLTSILTATIDTAQPWANIHGNGIGEKMGFEYAVLLLDLALPTFGVYMPGNTTILIVLANGVAVGSLLYRMMSPVYAQG